MANCEDCIHYGICTFHITGNENEKCPHYTPTADVVAVVRCKDCEYYKRHNQPIEDFDGWCSANEIECDTDFYCQYGKKS